MTKLNKTDLKYLATVALSGEVGTYGFRLSRSFERLIEWRLIAPKDNTIQRPNFTRWHIYVVTPAGVAALAAAKVSK